MADPVPQVIPSITGSPQLDTAIRYGLITGSTFVTGIIVGWLNAHHFVDPNLTVIVGGAVLTVMTAAATMFWGFLQNRMATASVVDHVTTAAITGTIPANVIAAATPAQEVKITEALNTAQLETKP